MIVIGLSSREKEMCIEKYILSHGIKKVFIFSYRAKTKNFFIFQGSDIKCPEQTSFKEYGKYGNFEETELCGAKVTQMEYEEVIMYRTFYPMIEEIDSETLIVLNECMRTGNRSDLHYNCIQKFTNQTEHRIVFEFFPFISDKKDFMILLDFDTSQQFKGQSIADINLKEFDIRCKRNHFHMDVQLVELPPDAALMYENEKNALFEGLGNKSPDTIPRQLHIWTGRFKRSAIQSAKQYVARNARFKLKNVTTFQNATANEEYILIDIPHARLDFNDFMRRVKQTNLTYLSTGFGVDNVYIESFRAWLEELEGFYASTGIYSENR